MWRRAMPIFGDPVRLSQMLMNLLDNSSKYTQNHGVIQLSAVLVGANLALTVSDNGVGITVAALARISTPSYRIRAR